MNFLTTTRPDLAYAVQSLSQFMHAPRFSHLATLLHTLRYVSHIAGQGILLKASDELCLQAKPSQTLTGPLVLILESPLLVMCYFLDVLLLSGNPRNKAQSLSLPLK